jgi:hypothetical protein
MATEEIKYMILHTWNKEMIQMHGEKLTKTQWAIGLRSNGLHQALQHSDRYGGISISATISDERKGVGFAKHEFSHPYRQSRVYIPVTAEQEALIFDEGCGMADIDKDAADRMLYDVAYSDTETFGVRYFGPDNIKYDTAGVSLSFISKGRWWNPSGERQWCNETCGLLLMVVWPDIFIADKDFCGEVFEPPIADFNRIPTHEQTPSQTEHLVRHYFDSLSRPTQRDIDNIISDVKEQ